MVENDIVGILRARFEDCMLYEAPDHLPKCKPLRDIYDKAAENWFIKCKFPSTSRNIPNSCKLFLDGDLGATGKAKECYMKQKHRLVWERRHGPVGSGMKVTDSEAVEQNFQIYM